MNRFIIIICLIFFKNSSVFANPNVDARTGILMDYHSEEILYELDPDSQIYPASMTKYIKIFTLLLTVSLCSWAIYHAGKLAIADVFHYPVKSWFESIDTTKSILAHDLDQAESKILLSISFNPDKADYQEYLGRIHYLRAINNYQDARLFRDNIQQAYLAHRQAIRLRPQWPYSWANLALMKSHMQQLDVEFLYAVNQAVRYGPWEISSNEAVVQAGFNGWAQLSENSQTITVKALERVYQQSPKTARQLIIHFGNQGEVCSMIKIDKFKADKVCKSPLPVATDKAPQQST